MKKGSKGRWPGIRKFWSAYWLNLVTMVMAVAALIIAVAILYHALLRYGYVSATALAGVYASEYEQGEHLDRSSFYVEDMIGGYSYFLWGKDGTLLFYSTESTAEPEELADYVRRLTEKIDAGGFRAYDDYILDLEGKKRGVYFVKTLDGSYSIITAPYSELLRSLRTYIYIFSFIAFMFLVGNVVTIRRSMRQQASNERLHSTVRALGNTYYGLYRVNYADGTYEQVRGSSYVRSRMPESGNYEDFLRISGEVIEESAFQEFCDSFSIENIKRLIQNRIRDFGGDFRRNFDGEYRWVNVSLRFDESLDKDEVLLCFREVNEEKQKQLRERQMLRDALEISDQNMKARQSFFNSMSHDMRTPLNAILGMTELARGKLSDPEKLGDYLNKIEYSGKQLLMLINDILDMSKAEQGRMRFNERAFRMSSCIRQALEPFRLQAASQGKTFEADIQEDSQPVLGDPDRIVQIINNLVSNAVKFTRKGDAIRVQLGSTVSGDGIHYLLQMEDTGIGMSQEFLPHLFEPYYQENRFISRNSLGTGLGMPIVNSLVNYMNGDIQVESEIDKGTCFRIGLLLQPAGEDAAEPEQPDTAPAAESAPEKENLLEGARILLAEDNEINMEIAEELLSSLGARVTRAWNGKEALELFRDSEEGYFDMILMDMQMPVMDGCEASRRIRGLKRADSGRIPIIAVTANAFTEDLAAQQAAGMNDHILKPIDFREMVSMLNRYLAKGRG